MLEDEQPPFCSPGFPSTPEPRFNLAEMGGWRGERAEKPRMPTPSEQPARGSPQRGKGVDFAFSPVGSLVDDIEADKSG